MKTQSVGNSDCLPNNGQEVRELFDKVHKHNLEKIRNENKSYKNNRKRRFSNSSINEIVQKVVTDVERETTVVIKCNSDSDSSELSDKIIKEYVKWKNSEFDTYNSIGRFSVLQSIDILEHICNEKNKKKIKRNCSILDQRRSSEILWSSSTYIIKYIRFCILQQNWKPLSYLLLHFLNHSKQYSGYIKEITFLTSLMTSRQDVTIMQHLKQCFIKNISKQDNKFDIWFVDNKLE